MSNMFQPYTYLLGWSKLDLWYYGARYAKNCHPNDLWTTYFTSSRYVHQIRNEHGEPDIIKIDKLFSTIKETLEYEKAYLYEHNAIKSKNWINRNIGGVFDKSPMTGKTHSDKTKRKMSKSSTGILHTYSTKQKMSIAKTGCNHPFYQKTHTKSAKKKISESQTGELNHQFKGFYITPWGKFSTTHEAAKCSPEKITYESIRRWCSIDNCKQIPSRTRKEILKPFVGKTYKDAGFRFEPC